MGEVVEEITIVNARDAANARSGYIKESEVRRLTVDAVVDTGAGPLVISEEMRRQLGLEIESRDSVLLAGGVEQECIIAEEVRIIWKGRHASSNPIVLPGGEEPLLGVIPLEEMDLLVNPVARRLEGVHGDVWKHHARRLKGAASALCAPREFISRD
jgi:clan AA aspartic protease